MTEKIVEGEEGEERWGRIGGRGVRGGGAKGVVSGEIKVARRDN